MQNARCSDEGHISNMRHERRRPCRTLLATCRSDDKVNFAMPLSDAIIYGCASLPPRRQIENSHATARFLAFSRHGHYAR